MTEGDGEENSILELGSESATLGGTRYYFRCIRCVPISLQSWGRLYLGS